jgi:hypothetical protein
MTHVKYFVVDACDTNNIDWNTVVENCQGTCRWNKKKTKVIVKSLKVPRWYLNKPIYTLPKIKGLLLNGEW